ncbi:Asp-tRNA(Asn)/Glu-tRNA(Gln) amidotransferase subunit GatB [Candidatus Kaiserbacteria bacterium]|nr:Asp-tRNA(Asn)/Glu-tRNA(Gln) amidotransferase subunit GatB [Candidatus Kaiserbacteria bacterium]
MYRPTIGLEIHAELKTRTKMFCSCANDPDETRPNVNICPICLAHPGTLPVANREAVRHILRVGTALGGALADYSEFDRKSYFYPDIPKGYQISQYANPLVVGGSLVGVELTRVHLEEDTARSIHVAGEAGDPERSERTAGRSLVDFNRAGIPLMELVTEPVIPDASTAGRFARELQLLLRTLGASEANLEKGEMRIEANVSVAKSQEPNLKNQTSTNDQNSKLGTKVEIKNLNSFRSVERAIDFEIKRQTKLLQEGGKVVQETRGWNEEKQETFHQRFKEGSADYRYFPEPDLPKLLISEIPEFGTEAIRASLPELPWLRRERYARDYALKENDIAYVSGTLERAAFFDAVAAALSNDSDNVRLAANYIVSDLAGIYAKKGNEDYESLDPNAFAKLIKLVKAQSLSSRGAKDTLALLVEGGGNEDPEIIAKEHDLIQVHDATALGAIVDSVIAREQKAVEEYRGGKQASLQYLVGQAMRESRGAGNPQELQKLLRERIG